MIDFQQIQAFLLDMDGLLVDSEQLQFEARKQTAQKFDHNLNEQEFLYFWFDGNGGTKAFCEKHHIPFAEFQNMKQEIFEKFIDEKLELCAGVENFLEASHQKHILAVCSNASEHDISRILERFDIEKYFSFLISGKDLEHAKPYPDIFLHAAKKLNVAPSKSVVFENSHIGLSAAKAAGMQCVLVPDFYGRKFQFTAADLLCDRIDEVIRFL